MNTPDPVHRLSQFPTSVVSDAIDELGLNGVIVGVHAVRADQPRIAGRALPVRLQPKSADPAAYRFGGGVGKPLEQVLATMKDGDVVVMDLGGSDRAAAWGGLASLIAQRRGVRGTVMWGSCRDVDEIRAVGYPVWTAHVSPRRSRNDFTFGSIGEPITIGTVTVDARDFVVADATGVIVVPADRIGDVLAQCERIAQQEAVLVSKILNDALSSWDEV